MVVLGVLALQDGVAQKLLGGLTFFSLITALFFEDATPVAHFPFRPMIAQRRKCVGIHWLLRISDGAVGLSGQLRPVRIQATGVTFEPRSVGATLVNDM